MLKGSQDPVINREKNSLKFDDDDDDELSRVLHKWMTIRN